MKSRYISIILATILVLTVVPSVTFAYDPSVDDIFGDEPVVTTVTTTTTTVSSSSTSTTTTKTDVIDPSNSDVTDSSTPDVIIPTTKPTSKPTQSHIHAYVGKITKKPTCSEEGIKTFTCNCGDVYTETISKLSGHKNVVKVINSTYFENGSKTTSCILCGKISKSVSLNKKVLNKSVFKLIKGNKKFKVNYKKVNSAIGFQVRYRTNGKWLTKTFNTRKSTTKTINKLSNGTYKVQLRVFRKLNAKRVYSRWTSSKKITV